MRRLHHGLVTKTGLWKDLHRTLGAQPSIRAHAAHLSLSAVEFNHPTGGIENSSGYCKELVRKQDYEGFLLHPFYPQANQQGYLALKAFYVELATMQESVSNPIIGKMRMQFWRDAIKSVADGKPTRHPVTLALYQVSQYAHLAPYHLRRIIDARDAELDNPVHMTVESLTSHAESTSSSLLYLLLSVLQLNARTAGTIHSQTSSLSQPHSHSPSGDPYDPDTLSHAASHLGVAQTVATLLRALPFHATKSRMVIPAEITAKHGVVQEEVFRKGGGARGLEDAAYEFACIANGHLNSAREMFEANGGKVPPRAVPIFLAGVPVASYLSRLEAVNFDAFHPSLQRKDWKLPWKVWSGYYKGTF